MRPVPLTIGLEVLKSNFFLMNGAQTTAVSMRRYIGYAMQITRQSQRVTQTLNSLPCSVSIFHDVTVY
jgi:hypothetical protein